MSTYLPAAGPRATRMRHPLPDQWINWIPMIHVQSSRILNPTQISNAVDKIRSVRADRGGLPHSTQKLLLRVSSRLCYEGWSIHTSLLLHSFPLSTSTPAHIDQAALRPPSCMKDTVLIFIQHHSEGLGQQVRQAFQ